MSNGKVMIIHGGEFMMVKLWWIDEKDIVI